MSRCAARGSQQIVGCVEVVDDGREQQIDKGRAEKSARNLDRLILEIRREFAVDDESISPMTNEPLGVASSKGTPAAE